MVKVTCEQCRKEFSAQASEIKHGHERFCSAQCYSNSKRIKKLCEHCGKEIFPLIADVNKGNGRFCSKKCFNESKKIRINFVCEGCGKDIFVLPSRVKERAHRFCSKKCQRLIIKKQVITCVCKTCGRIFTIRKCLQKRNNGHYCSGHCLTSSPERNALISMKNSGANSPNWRGGISFKPYCPEFTERLKEEIREKFNRKCFLCPTKEENRKLSVHHVDYQKSQGCQGQKWSLIPLCIKCHSKTNYNRWYWFCLLRDYWLNEYVNFDSVWCLM